MLKSSILTLVYRALFIAVYWAFELVAAEKLE